MTIDELVAVALAQARLEGFNGDSGVFWTEELEYLHGLTTNVEVAVAVMKAVQGFRPEDVTHLREDWDCTYEEILKKT